MKKRLSRPARELLNTQPSQKVIAANANLRFATHLGAHAASLTDAQLDALPSHGVIMFDPGNLSDCRVDFAAIAIKCVTLDDDEIRRALGGRLRAMTDGMFVHLEEWALIEAHGRGQPIDDVAWPSLPRCDRVACITTFFVHFQALDLLFERACGIAPYH